MGRELEQGLEPIEIRFVNKRRRRRDGANGPPAVGDNGCWWRHAIDLRERYHTTKNDGRAIYNTCSGGGTVTRYLYINFLEELCNNEI